MSQELDNFFIGIGFKIDTASQQQAVDTNRAVQRQITANAEAEGQTRMSREAFRQRLALAGNNDLSKVRIETETRTGKAIDKVRTDTAKKDSDRETDAAKKGRERRETTFKEVSKFALAFSGVAVGVLTAVQSVATGLTLAVGEAAKSFEQLGYASQRTGASAASISNFAYAISQLGGTTEGAGASLAAFSDRLKMNPQGFGQVLQHLGVSTKNAAGDLRDSGDILTDTLQALGKLPNFESRNYAETLGIDDYTRRAGANPRLREYEDQRAKDRADVGFDPDKAAAEAMPAARSMRRLEAVASDVGNKIKADLFDKVKPLLDQLADWITAHGKEIADTVSKIADGFLQIATTLTEKLKGIDYKALFGEKGGSDGLIPTLEALAATALLVNRHLGGMSGIIRDMNTLPIPGWIKALAALGTWGLLSTAKASADNIAKADATGQGIYVGDTGFATVVPPGGDNTGWTDEQKRNNPFVRAWNGVKSWFGGGGDNTHVSADGPRSGANNQNMTKENAEAIKSAAKELGTTPQDLATVIGYETGGTFSPSKWGGAGGRYMGLIQFGPDERRQYGADEGQTFPDQMKAVVRYLKGRGYKPGMGLLDLYSTINAGSPGHYGASDGNGTVSDHVTRMQGEMAARARAFLDLAPDKAESSTPNAASPAPDASSSASTPAAPAPASTPPSPITAPVVGSRQQRDPPLPPNAIYGVWDSSHTKFTPVDAQGRALGPDGKPTTPALTMPHTSLQYPIGVTPSLYASYDNSHKRGDTTITHNPTFNIQGSDVKANLDAAKLAAGRGWGDTLRNLQGAVA